MVQGPSQTFPDHSGKSLEDPTQNPVRPGRIPEYVGPFLDIRDQTDPSISSASRFPAGGAGQNWISAHERPNQAQNHIFGMVWFGRCERFQALRKISGAATDFQALRRIFRRCEGFRLANQDHASNPCASGVALFFFLEKCTSWKKVTCLLGIFGRFWLDVDPNMTQNVPGPQCLR